MRIGYDEECGSVIIVGRDVFPACALRATMDGSGKIRVSSLAETAELYTDWFRIETMDGRTFDTPEDAKAYVDGVLMRRPPMDGRTSVSVAASDLPAGFPVALSRADGQTVIARADTYALSFVAGLVPVDVAQGFAAEVVRSAVTLADWTAVIGSPSLSVGRPYFLAPSGGMTTTPDRTLISGCLVHLGVPLGPKTFAFNATDPITL